MDQNTLARDTPIFINSRDRLSCLRELLDWLRSAGHRNITIIDNASTYPPLLSFLDACSYNVVYLKQNLGHKALWQVDAFSQIIRSNYFVYTDPDVIPDPGAPKDAVLLFYRLLEKYPDFVKAGFGLRIDDLPDHYHLKQQVIHWEKNLYTREIENDVFVAHIDTTFAIYRPGTTYGHGPALRTGGVYCARHSPWYADSKRLSDEELYYRSHASEEVTHWNVPTEIAKHFPPAISTVRPRFGPLTVTINDSISQLLCSADELRRIAERAEGMRLISSERGDLELVRAALGQLIAKTFSGDRAEVSK
jgi:hypothetical protein